MTTLLAMGQFEAMIRFDANLRNNIKMGVYHHQNAKDDGTAVIYVDITPDHYSVMSVTRIDIKHNKTPNAAVGALVSRLEAMTGETYSNGILAVTANSVRFTSDFAKLVKENPAKAFEVVLDDPDGFEAEYHDRTAPMATHMAEELVLGQVASWIRTNRAQTRSYIRFVMDGEEYIVLGRQFREDSFLMLSGYNPHTQVAYFDGMIAGQPIHQRIDLDPDNYAGDKAFIQQCQADINEQGKVETRLWRIRHLGVRASDVGTVYVRGPHIEGRKPMHIPAPGNHDFTENRIVVL